MGSEEQTLHWSVIIYILYPKCDWMVFWASACVLFYCLSHACRLSIHFATKSVMIRCFKIKYVFSEYFWGFGFGVLTNTLTKANLPYGTSFPRKYSIFTQQLNLFYFRQSFPKIPWDWEPCRETVRNGKKSWDSRQNRESWQVCQGLSRVSFDIASLNKNVLPFTFKVFRMFPILSYVFFKCLFQAWKKWFRGSRTGKVSTFVPNFPLSKHSWLRTNRIIIAIMSKLIQKFT